MKIYKVSFLFLLIIFGMQFNFLAVMSNDCKMPVKTNINYSTDKNFSYLDNKEINNYFLVDNYKIGRLAFSIGDIIFLIGYIGVVYYLIKEMKQNGV